MKSFEFEAVDLVSKKGTPSEAKKEKNAKNKKYKNKKNKNKKETNKQMKEKALLKGSSCNNIITCKLVSK